MTEWVDNALQMFWGRARQLCLNCGYRQPLRYDRFPDLSGHGGGSGKTEPVPRSAYTLARSQLAQLAVTSGTKMYRANKIKDLDLVYDQVIKDLSMVYSLGYKPSNTLRDGKWRSVGVLLTGRQDVITSTKRGYFAGAEP